MRRLHFSRHTCPVVLLVLLLSLSYPALVQAQTSLSYYWVGEIDIETEDIQRVWRTRLKAETVQTLGLFNLLPPVFIDTHIDIGGLVADHRPLFLSSGSLALAPLRSASLDGNRGRYKEGGILDEEGILDSVAYLHGRAWLAVDSDGTLLIATDGEPMFGTILWLD